MYARYKFNSPVWDSLMLAPTIVYMQPGLSGVMSLDIMPDIYRGSEHQLAVVVGCRKPLVI